MGRYVYSVTCPFCKEKNVVSVSKSQHDSRELIVYRRLAPKGKRKHTCDHFYCIDCGKKSIMFQGGGMYGNVKASIKKE